MAGADPPDDRLSGVVAGAELEGEEWQAASRRAATETVSNEMMRYDIINSTARLCASHHPKAPALREPSGKCEIFNPKAEVDC